jgi:GNAT superfamily N-acetyltransferase
MMTSGGRESEQLLQAIENSLLAVTAWQQEALVDLVRAGGDGETILYIQDILVLKSCKRRGIGRQLLCRVLDCFAHVWQKVLLTDDTAETRGFYQAMGFVACEKGKQVTFVKFN